VLKGLKTFWQGAKRTVLLMVGIPDYQRYVQHCQDRHPGGKVMTYEEFFKNRQEGRYGAGKIGRCC